MFGERLPFSAMRAISHDLKLSQGIKLANKRLIQVCNTDLSRITPDERQRDPRDIAHLQRKPVDSWLSGYDEIGPTCSGRDELDVMGFQLIRIH